MAALLEYLKRWFSSLFGTVKQEFDGTVKKDIHESTEWKAVKPTETESGFPFPVFEKDTAKDVSIVIEDQAYIVVGDKISHEHVYKGIDTEIKEEKVSEVEPCKPHRSNKLTMDQARAIRADRDIKTIKELATEYSVSTDTIRRILNNKTYKEC